MRRIIALILTLTALTACQPASDPPNRAPWVPTTPAITMITVTIYPCGVTETGDACWDFDGGPVLTDNIGTEVPMPGGHEGDGGWQLTLPACHREDDAGPCIWTGAPDGKHGKGRHFIAYPPNLIFPLPIPAEA